MSLLNPTLVLLRTSISPARITTSNTIQKYKASNPTCLVVDSCISRCLHPFSAGLYSFAKPHQIRNKANLFSSNKHFLGLMQRLLYVGRCFSRLNITFCDLGINIFARGQINTTLSSLTMKAFFSSVILLLM